jgi:BMFP domain-containing protein YqiC
MVAGAGYAAGKSVQRGREREYEQEQRIADLEGQQAMDAAPPPPAPPPPAAVAPPPPPAPAAAPGGDLVSRLQQLKALQDQGVLTQEEFDAAKQKLLSS